MSTKNRSTTGRQPVDDFASTPAPAATEPDKAFVIHAQLTGDGGGMRGRVEHVVSGQSGRFADLDDLVEFVARICGQAGAGLLGERGRNDR